MSNIYEKLMAYRQEKAGMIADQEEEYSMCDPDWDNLERAAEKGIVAGAQWLAADFARRIKEGRSTDALLRICKELGKQSSLNKSNATFDKCVENCICETY